MKLPTLFLVPALLLTMPVAGAQAAPATTTTTRELNAKFDGPLIAAVKAGNAREVGKLLGRGANPNARETDLTATTALGLAAPNGNLEIVKLLVKAGADVENGNALGQTVLMLAALHNRSEVIIYMVERGAKVDNGQYMGLTPLMVAAAMGATDAARTLLRLGANVNARDKNNGTPLIVASSKTIGGRGNLATVQLLVQAGADLHATTNSGMDALDMAVKHNLADIATYLTGKLQPEFDLYSAAAKGAQKQIPASQAWGEARTQLDKGAKGTQRAENGTTVLMLFANLVEAFDEDVFKRLIAGGQVNAQSKNGFNALHLAIACKNERAAALLIAAGTDLSVKPHSIEGEPAYTALEMAEALGLANTIALIRKANTPAATVGAAPKGPLDTLNVDGKTPLMEAALGGDAAKVAQLLKEGATIDIANDEGQTALFMAAYGQSPEAIRLLIKGGANINHRDVNGESVLIAAAFRGTVPVMRALIEAGASRADVAIALGQATQGENKSVIEYLSGLAPKAP